MSASSAPALGAQPARRYPPFHSIAVWLAPPESRRTAFPSLSYLISCVPYSPSRYLKRISHSSWMGQRHHLMDLADGARITQGHCCESRRILATVRPKK